MDRVAMGNTFKGYLDEFPGIRVDCFDDRPCPRTGYKDKDVQFYLLTHAHSDHLTGLGSSNFSGRKVYCSEITKQVLAKDKTYQHNCGSLRTLTNDKRHEIPYNDTSITITPIESNHCPGSIMFLLESPSKSVLFTGDIRAERWWVDKLPRHPFLFPYTIKSKELTTIYLDTTYQYRRAPYLHMVQNYEGLQMLMSFIQQYPTTSNDVHFYLPQDVLGFEEVWTHISEVFNTKIHTSEKIRTRTQSVIGAGGYEYGKQLVSKMTTLKGPQFHVCGRPSKDGNKCVGEREFVVSVRAVIDLSYEELMTQSLPVRLVNGEVPPGFMHSHDIDCGKVFVDKSTEKKYLLLNGGDRLLGDELLYYFSRHSSYSECYNVVSMFNVNDVYPTVEDNGSWTNRGFSIQRHFGSLLNSKIFRYDQESETQYGVQEPSVMFGPPPETHEKQAPPTKDFKRSIQEFESSHDISFQIRGQQRIGDAMTATDQAGQMARGTRDRLVHQGMRLQGQNQHRVRKQINSGQQHKFTDKVNQRKEQYKRGEDDSNSRDEDSGDENPHAARAAQKAKEAAEMSKCVKINGPMNSKRPKLERVEKQNDAELPKPKILLNDISSAILIESQDYDGDDVVADDNDNDDATERDTTSFRSDVTVCDDEVNEEGSTKHEISALKDESTSVKIVIRSPLKEPSVKDVVDMMRVGEIEQLVRQDSDFGFFNFQLTVLKQGDNSYNTKR